MTKVDPLPHKLFNMVMYAVICHWVTVVEATEECMEGLGTSIHDLTVYFYSNDGLVVSTQPGRL